MSDFNLTEPLWFPFGIYITVLFSIAFSELMVSLFCYSLVFLLLLLLSLDIRKLCFFMDFRICTFTILSKIKSNQIGARRTQNSGKQFLFIHLCLLNEIFSNQIFFRIFLFDFGCFSQLPFFSRTLANTQTQIQVVVWLVFSSSRLALPFR